MSEFANYWGYHLSLDCGGCDLARITDRNNIYRFTKALVSEIDMVSHGEPQITNFGTGAKEGYTLVQLIETSNITAHFANESRAVYIDIFSCKPYDMMADKGVVQRFFKPKDIKSTFLYRLARNG